MPPHSDPRKKSELPYVHLRVDAGLRPALRRLADRHRRTIGAEASIAIDRYIEAESKAGLELAPKLNAH